MRARAAVLTEHGRPPVLQHRDDPAPRSGEALVDVVAAPITPLDVLCATGTSYFGPPALPYVPGVQGVGVVRHAPTLEPGQRVWFSTNAGMAAGDGSMATSCVVPETDLVPVTRDVPLPLVAALGLSAVAALMALTDTGALRPGEQVVVLGAGGVVGQVAVQLAGLLGAGRVVAACRSAASAERAARIGADAVVRLDTDDVDVLTARFAEATGNATDLVIDPLFGAPAVAALRSLAPHGRLVNLGGSAAPTATIDSATVRGRSLRLLGYTNNDLSTQQRAAALREVVRHAASGAVTLDYATAPLDEAPAAWARQASGRSDRRIVLAVPQPDLSPPPAPDPPGAPT